MSGSVGGTTVIIALLFWLTHRRWLPMLWLLTLLGLILARRWRWAGWCWGHQRGEHGICRRAAWPGGGLCCGALPGGSGASAIVRAGNSPAIAPSILWAAITTMSAFLVLNLGGLPGLDNSHARGHRRGPAALVMVMIYLPPLFPNRRKRRRPSAD